MFIYVIEIYFNKIEEKFNRRCKMTSVYQAIAGLLSMALIGFVLYWLGERLWKEEKRLARLE